MRRAFFLVTHTLPCSARTPRLQHGCLLLRCLCGYGATRGGRSLSGRLGQRRYDQCLGRGGPGRGTADASSHHHSQLLPPGSVRHARRPGDRKGNPARQVLGESPLPPRWMGGGRRPASCRHRVVEYEPSHRSHSGVQERRSLHPARREPAVPVPAAAAPALRCSWWLPTPSAISTTKCFRHSTSWPRGRAAKRSLTLRRTARASFLMGHRSLCRAVVLGALVLLAAVPASRNV